LLDRADDLVFHELIAVSGGHHWNGRKFIRVIPVRSNPDQESPQHKSSSRSRDRDNRGSAVLAPSDGWKLRSIVRPAGFSGQLRRVEIVIKQAHARFSSRVPSLYFHSISNRKKEECFRF
jgi:hypothetical protein